MAEDLQTRAWGLGSSGAVPVPLQRAIQDNGGLVLGAFLDIHLVGFNLAFVGWDGQELYYYSHLNAVLPEYRNHKLGFRLKVYQREEVLKQGLAKIRWVLDPVHAKTAHLTVRRLGARPDKFLIHYYGAQDSQSDKGSPTDRLRVTWTLQDSEVVRRLEGHHPTAEDDAARVKASTNLLETEVGEAGQRRPVSVHEPEEAHTSAVLEVPFDWDVLRENQPSDQWPWRQATREAFRAAFDQGWQIDDFVVLPINHERRAFYLLSPPATSKPTPAAAGATPPSPSKVPPRSTVP